MCDLSSLSTAASVLHFSAWAGDQDQSALQGAPLLAAALAAATHLPVTTLSGAAMPPVMPVGSDARLAYAYPALQALQDEYRQRLPRGQRLITALSRCAAALATIPAVVNAHPEAVIIWLDAHPDLNIPQHSPSGHLGGMALAGPFRLWSTGLALGAPLTASRLILAGTRSIDPFEQAVIEQQSLLVIPPGPSFVERLDQAIDGRPVYLHLDCDVLETGLVPNRHRLANGISFATLTQLAERLSQHPFIGLEISEFETADTFTATQTAAQRLTEALMPVLR